MPLAIITAAAVALSGTGFDARSTAEAPAAEAAAAWSADREAILGMAGAFRVSFRFEETVAVAADYVVAEPYAEEALELVRVIADDGDSISLQHLLVVELPDGSPMVVKHWRQDWTYQDDDLLAFKGRRTWERESRDAESVRGTWTQAVFQTTDAPRYEAVGRWTHLENQSSWTSEPTWRPLPRRERRRTDYHVVFCRNRHTLTPDGWVHEQDNQKLALTENGAPSDVVAHEIGVNSYTRIDEDAVAAAVSYWAEHEGAWAEIRAAWKPILDRDEIVLRPRVDGERLSSVVEDALEDDDMRSRLGEHLATFLAD